MKLLRWGVSLGLHSAILLAFFLVNQFSTVTIPEQSAPCTIPLDIQTMAPVSRAPKSKPKVDQVSEQQRKKNKEKKPKISEPLEKAETPSEEEASFEEILDRLEEKKTEKTEKVKKSPAKKAKKKEPPKKKKVTQEDHDEEIHALLKDIADHPKGPSAETPQTDEHSTSTYGAAEVGEDMAISILDRVQSLLQNAWRLPALADNGERLVVVVELELNPDATVAKATIVGGTTGHPAYVIAAESAVAAAFDPSCNPLPLPLNQYHKWKKLRITFTPH
jgi:outer membrane biosynthesis protein TonB